MGIIPYDMFRLRLDELLVINDKRAEKRISALFICNPEKRVIR